MARNLVRSLFWHYDQPPFPFPPPLSLFSLLFNLRWAQLYVSLVARAIVFKNTRRVVISVISQASAAGESNWRTIWCSAQLHQYCQAMPTCFCSFSFDISKYFCCPSKNKAFPTQPLRQTCQLATRNQECSYAVIQLLPNWLLWVWDTSSLPPPWKNAPKRRRLFKAYIPLHFGLLYS